MGEIKMDLGICVINVMWIELAYDKVQQHILVSTVVNLRCEFLERSSYKNLISKVLHR
jgi:hypothetical protein